MTSQPYLYFIRAVNVEPVCSTQTTMKVNVFRPGGFIYRTAVAGAMLRVVMSVQGENFYSYYNRWVNSKSEIGMEYSTLLSRKLPRVGVTDGVMLRSSKVIREDFNVILDGTATALGTIKRAGMGPLKVYGYQLFGLDSDLTRRVINYTVHYFWAPGAIWRFSLLSYDRNELERALILLESAMREFGFGAKHSFRGKMHPIVVKKVKLVRVGDKVRGRLIQPLLCGEGVSECLEENGLRPVGTMKIFQRMKGYQPKAEVIPAVWGEFEASSGYYAVMDGETYLVTEGDLSWPTGSWEPTGSLR